MSNRSAKSAKQLWHVREVAALSLLRVNHAINVAVESAEEDQVEKPHSHTRQLAYLFLQVKKPPPRQARHLVPFSVGSGWELAGEAATRTAARETAAGADEASLFRN